MTEGIGGRAGTLIYSIKLEPLCYLGSGAVVASEGERSTKPFVLEGPKSNEE